ncbi:MAG: GTP-binding protein [Rhodanobacter sp.]|nr:MAG: GTP-binding protein [Rhodanobacter sp.]
MKLDYLHLAEVKQFRRSLHLDGLTDGINLFVGPNESGKSTLVDAIRAAFFERYKSGSVDYLQPWGDSSGAPEVEIAFDWQGERWVLNKRFLNKPRCDLKVGNEHFSDTDAEDKLAGLFGYQFAGKGASRPEVQGIPGLLWVQQGTIQEIRGPVGYAGDQLQSALGTSLGEVAASAGDELTDTLEKQRGQWLTRTGKPTGDYKTAIDASEFGRSALADLDAQITGYHAQVDELGRLREQRRTIDQPQPWQAERALAGDAQNHLSEVRGWQSEQRLDEGKLKTFERSQELCRQQIQGFDADAKRFAKRAATKAKAHEEVGNFEARLPQVEARLTQANTAYVEASAAATQARQQAGRARLQADHDALKANLVTSGKTLKQAHELQKALGGLHEQRQASAIDEKALAKLKRHRAKLDELAIRRESLATRVQFDLLSDKSLTIGTESVTGKGERLLLETTELAIPKVGILRLQPGGTDIAELVRDQERVQAQHDGLLVQLGIATLAEGEQRVTANKNIAGQIEREAARLEGMVPQGVDTLSLQCDSDAARLQGLAGKLEQLPEALPDAGDEAMAEAALATAQTKLKAAEQAATELKQALAMAKQELTRASEEWEQLNNELESPEHKARIKSANDQLTNLNAEAASLQDAIVARQQQIDAAQPQVLQQDVERHTRSAEAMERAAIERRQAIDRLEATLETLGAQGLDEKRDTLQQEVEASERRRDELARRTAALNLLLSLLKDKRQALTRQLQAPLQKHLDHYLKLLFPHASLTVDENLMPQMLTRRPTEGTENGDVENLSYGTREQMGLISRLAYADLLREAGKPTLIILDDALVHSDADRLAQMKRILFDAATRHQVLLFSCHPDNWRDLGVAARDLQTLKAATA